MYTSEKKKEKKNIYKALMSQLSTAKTGIQKRLATLLRIGKNSSLHKCQHNSTTKRHQNALLSNSKVIIKSFISFFPLTICIYKQYK